ncbi:MAG: MBL fold metallo-hydrolase [Candidatus Rokubacteria bacterium]|nr:MBL fold metallo-hydrolase [Candidatus Rokubacteria bacterium]
MRTLSVTVIAAVILLSSPLAVHAQSDKAALDAVANALGADRVTSIAYEGSGVIHAVGQSATPGGPWPRFNLKSSSRSLDYDTGAMRDVIVTTQAENPPRGGGVQPARGERRQEFVLRGDHAWNMVGDAAVPAPITVADRQFQLWATPHGIVKAALAGKGSMQGRTITVAVPERFKAEALVNDQNLIEKVVGTVPNAVLGDIRTEIVYGDYKDFGGGKFPTKIRQSSGGHPSADVVVTDVQPNVVFDAAVPAPVRQTPQPYARVASQMVADGVWYITGGTHHSVLIEMKDYGIVVEGPLNDERAFAVIGEARALPPSKPIRYVVVSHHHFDHLGGIRGFAARNVTVITHESAREFVGRALAARATVRPDALAKAGRTGSVEGVRSRRVLDDGTRTVEIHHIAGNGHADDLLMVYLPKEKLLVEADVFTPLAPNVAPPTPPSPYTLGFADHLRKLKLDVAQILPLHGRIVPYGELDRTIGR